MGSKLMAREVPGELMHLLTKGIGGLVLGAGIVISVIAGLGAFAAIVKSGCLMRMVRVSLNCIYFLHFY